VWREGFTAAFRTLDPAEAEGLQAMREGMTFGALCDRLIASSGEAQGLALAGEMLGRWLAEGLVIRVS
jgi:hypothetical protein